MIRTLTFASLAILLSFATSQAQMTTSMACNDADMAKMQTQASGMTDATKKEMAMKEMGMAKDMMAQKKMDECMMHMKNADKAMH